MIAGEWEICSSGEEVSKTWEDDHTEQVGGAGWAGQVGLCL